jgi:hypothetical protein
VYPRASRAENVRRRCSMSIVIPETAAAHPTAHEALARDSRRCASPRAARGVEPVAAAGRRGEKRAARAARSQGVLSGDASASYMAPH